jgi:hypothetical protein
MRHLTHTDAEARDAKLTELTREHAEIITKSLAAEQPQNTRLICNLLGEYLADDQALAELVRETLAGTNSMQGVIQNVIFIEAEQRAEAELARIDTRRREEERYARIEQRVFAREFAMP